MNYALAVSVLLSVLASVIEVKPRQMRYWRTFAGAHYRRSQLGLTVIYALVGLGGWYLNKEFVIHPADSEWLANGLLSFGIGQAIFRVDPAALDVEGRGPARSLLIAAQRWLIDDVKDRAFNGVYTSVDKQTDEELEQLAFNIAQIGVVNDPNVPDAAKVQTLKTITDAAKEMTAGQHSDGRARLIGFCVKMIAEKRYSFTASA